MALAALLLYVLWLAVAFGYRSLVQIRRTGDSGFRGISGSPGSIEWFAGVLFVVALVAGVAGPILDLADVVGTIPALDHDVVNLVGTLVAAVGVLVTLAAQLQMGESWRIGVDHEEETALVLSGGFRLVRNPIFSAMVVTAAGLVAMVPNVVALAGVAALLVALELQVRRIEEPYLWSVHGADYGTYEATVGRFVPGLGRSGLPTT
jgi:protein-S-isoprenylcysteine O-methyltransferase Ste14